MLTASQRHLIGVSALLLLVVAASVLSGLAIGLGSNLLTMMVVAAIVGPMLLLVPTSALVVCLLMLSFVVTGLSSYYGRIGQVHWLPYIVCLWLWMKLPIDALVRRSRPGAHPPSPGPSGPGVLLGLFMLTGLLSTAFNATPMLSFLVGAKNYIFIWGLALVVASGVLGPEGLRRVWLALLVVAALQAPFAVQQHYLNFTRSGSWDAVVGTFGGDAEGGGGASGAMVIYLSVMLGCGLACWRRRCLPRVWVMALAAAVLLAVAMAEVKAFFVLMPLMVGVVMLRELRDRPALGLAVLLGCGVIVAALFGYYKQAYYDRPTSASASVTSAEYLDHILSVDSRLDFVNRQTGEVSRIGAPLLWDQEVRRFGPEQRWLGFGLRACRVGNLVGAGDAARHFSFNLTTSAVTVLLWDVGLIGFAGFVALLASTGWLAWRLSSNERIPDFHRAQLEACAGAMLVLLASLPYNDAVVDHYTIQTLLALVIGYVLFWRRQLVQVAAVAKANP